ncbi:SDR family oxidoreductase [Armatimonas rosea]|uniref:NAD(P)-dependent dehydrogenase (Short-subunit alcohol dehydrogenase family) n=1 Tax=Armatimonas rosea TaxID=685828 RepID=A0A7W9SWC0_ARMRO|nr:SDR family oxidoreductase [Armatimonas rosea]MBB6054057.1 NAD(P)-dependent dehydrogenase (short-subunit alcohol dehydrogenase family) [Armatimonas rosea]
MNALKIKGAVALVTGANRGLGYALTEELLDRGIAKVYAAARNLDTLGFLKEERVVPLKLDVTDESHTLDAIQAAADVEIVFNNAGLALSSTILGPESVAEARKEMEVNFFGPLRIIHTFAPALAQSGRGVVNIGSLAGLASVPFMPTYGASKAALHSLTQAARSLFGAQGTAVHGVYAGPIDTDMARGLEIPKASAREVAAAILDAVEAGVEDIYPDAFAESFAALYESSPKRAEKQFAAMEL